MEPSAPRPAETEDSPWQLVPASLLPLVLAAPSLSWERISAWFWLGALGLNVFVRLLAAGDARQSAHRARIVTRISFFTDGILWTGLLLSIDPMGVDFGARVCAAIGGAILLSSISSAGRTAPFLLTLGWVAPVVALGVHSASGPALACGLALWLASVVWLGSARGDGAGRSARSASPGTTGWSRRGVRLAVQSSHAPMIAVQDGYIFEINDTAARLLGRRARDCLGRRLGEIASLDPVNVFDLAYGAQDGIYPAAIHVAGAADPSYHRVRVRVGRWGMRERIAVVSFEIPEPVLHAPHPVLAPDAFGARLTDAGLRPRGAIGLEPAPAPTPGTFDLPFASEPTLRLDPALAPTSAPPSPAPAALTAAAASNAPAPSVFPSMPAASIAPAAGPDPVATTAAAAPAPASAREDSLSPHLPMLAWVVDAKGRILATQGGEPRRWGMLLPVAGLPDWREAFGFSPASVQTVERALAGARQGRPSFDLVVERRSTSGGTLRLRSHFASLGMRPSLGEGPLALVMDTVASAQELLAVERLQRRKDQYKSLVEASPNLVWACDANFRFTFASRRAARDLYGYAVEDLIGVSMGVLLDPSADQTQARRAMAGLREGHALRDFEMSHITRDGRRIVVGMNAAALAGPQGGFSGAVGIIVDITVLKQREENLAEALRLERSLLDSAGQALAVVRDGQVSRCNDALLQLLRAPARELASVPIADLFVERSEWEAAIAAADRAALADHAVVREIRVRRSLEGTDDHSVWCQLTVRAIGLGEYVIALADIDSIRRREAHALFDARHDELTGLANRRLFSERARAAMATSALRNAGCAIVVIDLDGFKAINDQYGHQAGDEVIQEVSRRLQRVVRPQDTVARHGGDEFALLIPDAGSRRDIEAIAHRIVDELSRPVRVTGHIEERLSASVGIALAHEHGRDPTWLLSLADRAMYDAKTSGGNRAVFAENLDIEVPAPPAGAVSHSTRVA